MRCIAIAFVIALVACGGAEGAPAPPAACPAIDAAPEASVLPDAALAPAVCVSEVGGVDGGAVATCDAPGAFTFVDVAGLLFDCAAAPCPRGTPCRVMGRFEWHGVCR